MHRVPVAALLLMTVVLQGCSREANIHVAGGGIVGGEVVASDAFLLYLEVETGKSVRRGGRWVRQSRPKVVNRGDVVCIDHPGTVAMFVFGAVAMGSAALAAAGLVLAVSAEGEQSIGPDPRAFGAGVAVIGSASMAGALAGFGWGLNAWLASKEAAADESILHCYPLPRVERETPER